jgi:phage-related protein
MLNGRILSDTHQIISALKKKKDKGSFIVKIQLDNANTVFLPLYVVDVSKKLFLCHFFQKRPLLIHPSGLQGLHVFLQC